MKVTMTTFIPKTLWLIAECTRSHEAGEPRASRLLEYMRPPLCDASSDSVVKWKSQRSLIVCLTLAVLPRAKAPVHVEVTFR